MSHNIPKVSVVVTCFAEGELIFEAVNSVQKQSAPPLEIIIVNDASKDQSTLEVCRQLEKHPNIKLVYRTQNGGPATARNDGFRSAAGEILVPLDADDVLPEKALEFIQNAFFDHPETDFVYGNYLKQNYPNDSQIIDPGDISLGRMLKSRRFSPSSQWTLIGTTPLRKRLWESLGECDPLLGAEDLHDLEFWLRAIASGCKYRYIPEVIYIWRKYLGQNSRKVTPLAWYKLAKTHLATYRKLDLDYRAYELLLLGSKWMNNPQEIQTYSQAVVNCIKQGRYRVSTLIALALPTWSLRFLAQKAIQKR
jgi:glycosyltransferase involved in cell wall biosynthesis